MYYPIADYAVIGDMHSAALVSRNGSIDWACLPNFDSPAVFLRILDDQKGGYCAVIPANTKHISRRYLPCTNVLQTTFHTETGALTVTDFMPVRAREQVTKTGQDVDSDHRILRLLRCMSGSVTVRLEVCPAFNFASSPARISRPDAAGVIFHADGHALHLHGPAFTIADERNALGEIHLKGGHASFVALTYSSADEEIKPVRLDDVEEALTTTEAYWREWSDTLAYDGEHRDEVCRSALTLKLLTFEPTGAVVASPTTSLPEQIGGQRNWDYRFTWIRDATFTLTALMSLGYFGEAHDFIHFLRRTCPNVEHGFQILYGIQGEREQEEFELPHLSGYRNSRPVRVGNAAARQKQLDVYGELLQCLYLYATHEAFAHLREEFLNELWPVIRETADHVTHVWRQPDSGLWEVRGPNRHFVDSKALCWVALDRAIRLAGMAQADVDLTHWTRERDAIYRSVIEHGFNRELQAFVQSYGSDALDASSLRLPLLGFIDINDPRMVSTIRQIEKNLVHNGLVCRYRGVDDGVGGSEGTFAMCTFWLIDDYVLLGRLDEAQELFRHVLSFQNDVGLFAEEIDPVTHELLGNFPQGFTHISLINTAVRIAAALAGKKPTAHAIVERASRPSSLR